MNVFRIVLFFIGNGLEVNYEKYIWYNIILICSDSGGLLYEKVFVIKVLDVNDFFFNVIFINLLGDIIFNLNLLVNILDIKLVIQVVVIVNEMVDVGIIIVVYVRVIDEDNFNNFLWF